MRDMRDILKECEYVQPYFLRLWMLWSVAALAIGIVLAPPHTHKILAFAGQCGVLVVAACIGGFIATCVTGILLTSRAEGRRRYASLGQSTESAD